MIVLAVIPRYLSPFGTYVTARTPALVPCRRGRAITAAPSAFKGAYLRYSPNLTCFSSTECRAGRGVSASAYHSAALQRNSVISGGLERAAGIEPASLAWKAKVLPLHNARDACGVALFVGVLQDHFGTMSGPCRNNLGPRKQLSEETRHQCLSAEEEGGSCEKIAGKCKPGSALGHFALHPQQSLGIQQPLPA